MYKAFEKETIFAYIAFLFLLGILFYQIYFNQHLVVDVKTSFVFQYLLKITHWNIIVLKLMGFVLILTVLFLYAGFYKNLGFYYKSGLLVQTILLINLIIGFEFEVRIESLISLNIFFIILYILVSNESKKQTIQLFFQIGIFCGLSTLISLDNILMFPAIFFSVFIYGKSGWRDLAALLLGAMVPFYIIVTYFILKGNFDLVLNYIQILKTIHYDPIRKFEWALVIMSGLSAIAAIPSIPTFNVQTRKFFTYSLIMLLTILPFFVFLSLNENKPLIMLMVVGSFYFNSYFSQLRKNKMKNLLLFLGILMAIIATFVSLK